MGTNYYAVGRPACESCGRPFEDSEIHLGKSSGGWEFTFAWNDGQYYKNLDEFKSWLAGKTIRDEYDKEVTQQEFWDLVDAKKGGLTLRTYYEKYPEHRHGHSFQDYEIEVDGVRFHKGEFS